MNLALALDPGTWRIWTWSVSIAGCVTLRHARWYLPKGTAELLGQQDTKIKGKLHRCMHMRGKIACRVRRVHASTLLPALFS